MIVVPDRVVNDKKGKLEVHSVKVNYQSMTGVIRGDGVSRSVTRIFCEWKSPGARGKPLVSREGSISEGIIERRNHAIAYS